jgi:diguanylate cyclase (GGDEF)-like protein/PAS domain S-box-containing protein
MSDALAVLIVEDSESDTQMITRVLTKAGYQLVFEQVDTAIEMKAALGKQAWDIVISDYSLPQFDGRAALEILKETGQEIPFIIVSGAIGEETAVSMMKAGAHDYLTKDNLARLAPAVARELEQAQDRRGRKQAEQALRASENQLRMITDNIPAYVAYVDSDLRYRFINKAYEILYEKPRAEIIGRHASEVLNEDYYEKHLERIQIVLTGQKVFFETPFPFKEGQLFLSVSYIPDTDEKGNTKGYYVLAHDITERKQVEDQLRQLSLAVECNPASIIITDLNGNIEYVNPKFTELTEYTYEEARGNTPRMLQSGRTPSEVYANLWQTILSGRQWNGDLLNRKKNGRLYWENTSISSITDSKGKMTHFIAVNEDITARKEAEEKIQQLNIELEKLAITDYLTNLYNRRYFMERGAEEFKRAQRTKHALSILMLDIDEFKNINDTYGHETGDFALRQVVAALKSNLREIDLLGRMGGDEFTALLPNTKIQDAVKLAERVRLDMERMSFQTPEASFTLAITISIGVAALTHKTFNVDDMLRNADTALYQAKRAGRNCVVKYESSLTKDLEAYSVLDDD